MGEEYYRRGDLQQAISHGTSALELREGTLEWNPEVATDHNNLGVYFTSVDTDRAQMHLQKALYMREEMLGPEHPATAVSLTNLAFLHETVGDFGRAEQLYLRALTIRETTLGSNNEITIQSVENLARFYSDTGEQGLAEKYLYLSERRREDSMRQSGLRIK